MNYLPRLYFAYGSNLNHDQMSQRCPEAVFVDAFYLRNWRLQMLGHANILPQPGDTCPGALWKITPRCLEALDIYEGLGDYYQRRECHQDGQDIFFYEMINTETRHYWSPTINYVKGILEGYHQCGIVDTVPLLQSMR